MKVFLTGATGFIGSYLTRELLNMGHEVLCLKRESSNLFRLENILDNINLINLSEDWQSSFKIFKPDVVFNLAWDGVSSQDRIIWFKQVRNIELQQELLDLSLESGVKKFIGTGSQSEYGDFEGTIDETYPTTPKTAYAATKLACLDVLKAFCEINNIEWYWFRIFPQFGPYESENWLIPSLINNMMTRDFMDLTPGEQQLPYLYVGECAKAIASVMNTDGKSGVYNICADNPQPLKNLVTSIRDKVNPDFTLKFGAQPYRYGQSMYMCGDTSKLKNNLYELKTTDFEERLEETIKYYVNKYSRLKNIR